MPLRSILSYFALTIVLRSCVVCDGLSGEAEEERPAAVPGSHHLSRVGSGRKGEPGSLRFSYDQKGDFNSTNALHSAKLKRLAPSVNCGSNQMTLSVKRRGTHHFLIDSGEEPLTPLSQVPSTCGFFVKRSRRDVQYAVSYQGCHVNKQEDEYSLPLRLWGEPMTMSCPGMLPLPSIFCFPDKMVVTIRGVPANELKVKVSGTWQPSSSACISCRLTFNESFGELTLIAPYNKDLCVEFKDGEYLLSLQWADFELAASCPPVPNPDLTTGRAAPSIDSNKALQLQFPQLPIFSQFLESTQSPGFVAPLPFSFVAADFSENQKMPENQNSPLLPNFFLFPGSESPAHPTRDGNAHTSQHQLPQTPLSQYPVPLFQEFPMMSGVFLPTTTPLPLPATSAEAIVTTPAPTGSEKPSLQPEFPALFQYPFPSFSKYPQSPQEQTADDADFKPQYLHPQVFQIPMFYPFNHLSQLQNAPAPVAFTDPPPSEKPLYQQHRFIPVYVVPNPILPIAGIGLRNPPVIAGGFLNPPAMTSSHLVPSSQQEHQHFYHAMQPFYPFLSDQSQTAPTNI
ncbi:uncharacterized protein LOC102233679 isoform X2 [Xiphophorus maculatus]|uniref:Uncharacterized LOC102233679 n=1 Tax=Xiphophorus maculatus TaxID=8083 RepID=A0A3B5QBP6_XIPMA|nr:uncharacterized protein LOC102233679 isoform X2 [Xiphophorus maculatus]